MNCENQDKEGLQPKNVLVYLFFWMPSVLLVVKVKGKAVSIYEPPLFQGLPHRHMLTSNSPVSRGTVALSTQWWLSLHVASGHPWYKEVSVARRATLFHFIPPQTGSILQAGVGATSFLCLTHNERVTVTC